MNIKEFERKLYLQLKRAGCKEVNEVVTYYLEIIHDKMDNGTRERVAVESVGSIDDIVRLTVVDYESTQRSPYTRVQEKYQSTTSVGKVFFWATGIIWMPIVLSLFLTGMIVGIVVPFALGLSSVLCALAVIPNVIAGIAISATTWEIIHASGFLLVASSLLGLIGLIFKPLPRITWNFTKKVLSWGN